MSKISKEGHEKIKVIKRALDSMYDKLSGDFFVMKKHTKNVDSNYQSVNVFDDVKLEFQAIADVVEESGAWEEV